MKSEDLDSVSRRCQYACWVSVGGPGVSLAEVVQSMRRQLAYWAGALVVIVALANIFVTPWMLNRMLQNGQEKERVDRCTAMRKDVAKEIAQ